VVGALPGQPVFRCTYDALGRLVRVAWYQDAFWERCERYVYDGVRRIQTLGVNEPVAGGPVSGFARTDYVYGPGAIDAALAGYTDVTPGSGDTFTTQYFLADHNLNVVGMTDAAGELEKQYTYDPYGTVAISDDRVPAQNTASPGYQGMFAYRLNGLMNVLTALDPAAEVIYYYRNRWYLPAQGRFTSRDPNETGQPVVLSSSADRTSHYSVAPPAVEHHFVDGLNLSAHLRGDPVNTRDPLGLFSLLDLGAANLIGNQLDSVAVDMGFTLAGAVRGFTEMVSTRNVLLGELMGTTLASPDMSGVDTMLAAYDVYQVAQLAMLGGGVVKAGIKFGKRGAMALVDALSEVGRPNGHHGIPMFMGGALDQILYRVPRHLHRRFHSLLDGHLRANGFPPHNKGFMDYLQQNPGDQQTAFAICKEVAVEFDAKHGTSFATAFDVNFLQQNFTAIGW
jgi:RHS repeat-associated protein